MGTCECYLPLLSIGEENLKTIPLFFLTRTQSQEMNVIKKFLFSFMEFFFSARLERSRVARSLIFGRLKPHKIVFF